MLQGGPLLRRPRTMSHRETLGGEVRQVNTNSYLNIFLTEEENHRYDSLCSIT